VNCFYHPERSAVGVCKHCGRGLCAVCAALVDDTLACKDRHEAQVKELNLAAQRTIVQALRIRTGFIRNAVFYGLVGVAFAAFGIAQYRYLGLQGVFFMVIGIFLLYAALANYMEARKYN
jgi:sulfite exporter TauE/SafE